VGFIESIVVAKLYSTKYNYHVSPNRELVAFGMANLIGSFFRIYPTFGSLPRSAVADNMGAQSQLHNFIASLCILVTILFVGGLFYYLPIVVMASIIIVAACWLIELHDILFLWKIKAWKGIVQLVFTFLMTFILGPELGIFISIGISIFFIIQHTSLPHITVLGRDPDSGKYKDDKLNPNIEYIDGLLIVRIEEPLYFANIEMIKGMLGKLERYGSHIAHPTDNKSVSPLWAIVIHARNISDMDSSATQVMAEMMQDYTSRRIFVCFVKLHNNLKKTFLLTGILDSGGRSFDSIEAAVKYLREYKQKQEQEEDIRIPAINPESGEIEIPLDRIDGIDKTNKETF